MINPTGYRVTCDQPGCDEFREHENIFTLYDEMEDNGWQRHVRLNGQRSMRNGKDYCPDHLRSAT